MTARHTPGPWLVNPGAGEVRGADWNVIVADVGIDADAHLIAAAPDLLAACEAALACLVFFGTDQLEPFRAQCRAVIAKAKGETK